MSLVDPSQLQSRKPASRPRPNARPQPGRELTVREMLDDAIVKLVMRRDGVTESDILDVVDTARASLRRQRAAAPATEAGLDTRAAEYGGI